MKAITNIRKGIGRLKDETSDITLTTSKAVNYLVVTLATLAITFPIYWMVSTGLRTPKALSDFPPELIPVHPTLDPVIEAWQIGPWDQWFMNTFFLAIGATVVTLAICVPTAYVLARREFTGRKTLYVSIMAFLIFPHQVLIVPVYLMYNYVGLGNSHIGLMFIYAAVFSGFTTFLLWGFFQSLPTDIEDAARIAGIPEWKTFVYIILPQAKPGIGVAAIFVFVFTWNEYLWALVFLTDRATMTISVGLPLFQGLFGDVAMSQMMAMSTLASIPVLLLFAVTQERFMKGIATGYEL